MSSHPEHSGGATGVDFFRYGALPAPAISTEEAERIASELGLIAHADPLGSQQDANFLLIRPDATVLGVLKIANPAFSPAEITAQDEAAAFISVNSAKAPYGVTAPPTTREPSSI
ncbi:MAG: hypothetical protein WAK82_03120, partial [Streptosporangiaceae bacterium]